MPAGAKKKSVILRPILALKILKLKKGAHIYLIGGKHGGNHGVLREIDQKNVIIEDHKKNTLETLKKYVVVVGEGELLLKLHE